MNETTDTIRLFAREGDNELHIDADTALSLARYGNMVGGGIDISCPKGFATGNDGILEWIEYSPRDASPDAEYGITLVYRHDGPVSHRRHRICPSCHIAAVVDLGTVTT